MSAILEVTLTTCFSAAMDTLRSSEFQSGRTRVASLRDPFDDDGRSRYLTVSTHTEGELIATLRLTPHRPGERGVVETWTSGRAPLPTGAGVVDISRVIT